LVEGEFSTPRNIEAGVPEGSVLAPILYRLFLNDAPAARGTHLALFADDTCTYPTEKHERRVLSCGLTAVNSRCEQWNIKINERKTRTTYFSRILRVPDDVLQLIGQDTPFVNNVTYLGVTFDRGMIWRLHIERTVAEVLRTYIRTYFLFETERSSTNIKLTLYKALIRSVMTYACPTWEYTADAHLLKLHRLQNRVLRAIGNLGRSTPVREMHVAFKIPYVLDYVTKLRGT
jgi:hypothetical protein